MPISIKRIKDQDLTVFVVTDELPIEELWQTVKSSLAGEPTSKSLWDARETKGIPGYPKNIGNLLSYTKRHGQKRPPGKTAIVTSTARYFGLTKVTEAISEILEIPWEFRSFRTIEEAVEWLDVNYTE